jgi:hypothetical protein
MGPKRPSTLSPAFHLPLIVVWAFFTACSVAGPKRRRDWTEILSGVQGDGQKTLRLSALAASTAVITGGVVLPASPMPIAAVKIPWPSPWNLPCCARSELPTGLLFGELSKLMTNMRSLMRPHPTAR